MVAEAVGRPRVGRIIEHGPVLAGPSDVAPCWLAHRRPWPSSAPTPTPCLPPSKWRRPPTRHWREISSRSRPRTVKTHAQLDSEGAAVTNCLGRTVKGRQYLVVVDTEAAVPWTVKELAGPGRKEDCVDVTAATLESAAASLRHTRSANTLLLSACGLIYKLDLSQCFCGQMVLFASHSLSQLERQERKGTDK